MDFLHTNIAQNNKAIEWLALRPDTLTDGRQVTEYDVYAFSIRNTVFDSGATSRIDVANIMAELVLTESMWSKWKGQIPVIYNRVKYVD